MAFGNRANRLNIVGLVLVASALAFVGCGDDDVAPPTDMGCTTCTDMNMSADLGVPVDMSMSADMNSAVDMPAIIDAGPIDFAFPTGTLTINGMLTELTATGAGGPIAGATICVVLPLGGPCVTSAADGSFTATGIPASTEMLLELTAPTFFPALATVTSGTTDVAFSYLMATRATVSTLGLIIGERIDATKGQIFVQSGDLAGVTVTLAPASGTGPFYSGATGIPSRTLTETTTSGASVFANVPAGDYVVTFSHATAMCSPTGFSWSGTVAETTRVTVQADRITSTVANCI